MASSRSLTLGGAGDEEEILRRRPPVRLAADALVSRDAGHSEIEEAVRHGAHSRCARFSLPSRSRRAGRLRGRSSRRPQTSLAERRGRRGRVKARERETGDSGARRRLDFLLRRENRDLGEARKFRAGRGQFAGASPACLRRNQEAVRAKAKTHALFSIFTSRRSRRSSPRRFQAMPGQGIPGRRRPAGLIKIRLLRIISAPGRGHPARPSRGENRASTHSRRRRRPGKKARTRS